MKLSLRETQKSIPAAGGGVGRVLTSEPRAVKDRVCRNTVSTTGRGLVLSSKITAHSPASHGAEKRS